MAKTIRLERHVPVRALELRLKRESNRRLRDRLQALQWVSEGLPVQDVARRIGRCRQAVSTFVHKFNQEGLRGLLNVGRGPGRQSVLNNWQWNTIIEWIQRGPRALGQPFSNWDCKRLAVCIHRRWKVALSDEQIRRQLHKMGCRLLRPTQELPGKNPRERAQKNGTWRFLWVAPGTSGA